MCLNCTRNKLAVITEEYFNSGCLGFKLLHRIVYDHLCTGVCDTLNSHIAVLDFVQALVNCGNALSQLLDAVLTRKLGLYGRAEKLFLVLGKSFQLLALCGEKFCYLIASLDSGLKLGYLFETVVFLLREHSVVACRDLCGSIIFCSQICDLGVAENGVFAAVYAF